MELLMDPQIWVGLLTLVVLEIVLGIDNLVFIAILSNKLPKEQQQLARRIGHGLALGLRIALLLLIGWIVTLQTPLFDLGLTGAPGPHGEPGFETAFSGRDLILIAGGLFLLWKATKEIHHNIDQEGDSGELLDHDKGVAQIAFSAAIAQIIALDLVFSVDSILTAVGMTDQVAIMIAAVIITVVLMMLAADPLSRFIEKNPTLVMLALAFLVMIGVVLIADGFQVMVYCSDDPIAAKQLEELGCVAVMPLASLIGSGMGILNPWNLQIIIDQAKVPIIVDAGVGTASDAAIAMELGCDGILMNTAIALAKNPVLMATAMRKIAADDYFQGMFETALEDAEIITEITFPIVKKVA